MYKRRMVKKERVEEDEVKKCNKWILNPLSKFIRSKLFLTLDVRREDKVCV